MSTLNIQKFGQEVLPKAAFWTGARLLGNNDILPERGRIIDTGVQTAIFFAGKSLVRHFVEPRQEFQARDAKAQNVARYALSCAFTLVTVLALYNLIGQKICEQKFARKLSLFIVDK